MNIFDLILIVFVLVGIAAILVLVFSLILGRKAFVKKLMKVIVASIPIYLIVVLVSSFAAVLQEIHKGVALCFDDWCITVEDVQRTDSATLSTYTARFLLSSRARGVTQRENGVVVYLSDGTNSRYDPVPDSSAVLFNTALGPQQSVETVRRFEVPIEAKISGLVIAHEGGFPIDWFIIGHGPFEKAPIFRLGE